MSGRSIDGWSLSYARWDPQQQPLREALTTLGNGCFATRGACEAAVADGVHYPGTYLAGGYDRLESHVAGRVVENEDLVNWPNWLLLSFRVEDGDWFDLGHVELLDYAHTLDLRRGLLLRRLEFRDGSGRTSRLESQRLVHMRLPQVGAIAWTLTALDWSGNVEIRSGIDGRVANLGVQRYRDLSSNHLTILETGVTSDDAVYLVSRTMQSRIVMAQAVRTYAFVGDRPASFERRAEVTDDQAAHHLFVRCQANKPLRVEKVLAMSTSKDLAISEPCHEVCKRIGRLPRFESLLVSHEDAWRYLWRRVDMVLQTASNSAGASSDASASQSAHYPQLVLRLHLFHLLQTTSVHSIDRDVGVPARGLHGEAYRGHIFWDELFIFPLLNFHVPELTRSLLLYRYRRLGEARHAARQAGYCGAMFPWQSGSDGREETQTLHLNPKSNRWLPDETHRQRHVNAAIAYNVWQYYQATHDLEFMNFHGLELLLDIAQFFASLTSYNPARDRFEIHQVVGPDEFHTRYPDRDVPGIDNNAYTNVMAAWVLCTAQAALNLVADARRAELLRALNIDEEALQRWDRIGRRMFVPFHGNGIISQFEGWERLDELDWEGLRERHGDIHRLDRVLEAEGDDPNRYQATKQADVLMLFYLFSSEELQGIFSRLGYAFDPTFIPHNVDYYLARTSHGSTLSKVVHAWVLARADRRRSWPLFQDALASDVEDVQRGTTSEGIHLGAMAGTVDLIQRGYPGIEMRDDVLWLNPQLPDELASLRLTLRYHGHWLNLHITQTHLTVSFETGWAAMARIGFGGQVHEMCQGEQRCFSLSQE